VSVNGVHITTDKVLTPVEVNGLADYQRLVGGYIECVEMHTHDNVFLNEEGKLDRLPLNSIATDILLRIIGPYDVIVGDVVIVGRSDGQGEIVKDISPEGKRWIKLVAREAGATFV